MKAVSRELEGTAKAISKQASFRLKIHYADAMTIDERLDRSKNVTKLLRRA